MKNQLGLLLIIILAMHACSKKESFTAKVSGFDKLRSESSEAVALMNFVKKNHEGNVYIQNFERGFNVSYSTTAPRPYTITGNMGNGNYQLFEIGDIRVCLESDCEALTSVNDQWAGRIDLQRFEGTSPDIVQYNPSNTVELVRQTMYFPLSFEGTIPDTIRSGSTITWNPDPANEKGVIIILRFSASLWDVLSEEEHYIYVNDAGSYEFSSSDLSPASQHDKFVEVRLVRGNYSDAPLTEDPNNMNAVYIIQAIQGFSSIE